MNKIFTQRKIKLSTFENAKTNESQIDYFSNLENTLKFDFEPSERVIQNILNYAKSLEVLNHKNSVSLVFMN